MRAISRLFDDAIGKLGLVGAFAIIFVAVLSVAEIFRRYVLNAPSVWATDLTIAISAVTYVLAGPYAHLYGRHIEITVFSDTFAGLFAKAADLLKSVVGLVYIGALLYGASQMAWTSVSGGERTGTAWDVPAPQVIKVLLVVALVLFLALIARRMVRAVVAIVAGGPIKADPTSSDREEIL